MTTCTATARKELGLLILVILKAQHLPDPHKFSKQDPFVIAQLGEGADAGIVRTKTDKGGGQHPLWDEEFRLKLYGEEGKLDGQRLTIKMMRKEGSRAKDEELIGEGSVLVDGKSWIEFDEWIELKTSEGKYVGDVYLEMTFYPLEVQQQKPSASNLLRHPSKLDPSTRAPIPSSLQPGSLHQSLSQLTLDDRYRQQAPQKQLPPAPPANAQTASPDLLPFPGDPEPSHTFPDSLRPGVNVSRPSSVHNVPTVSESSLPLPGEPIHSQSYERQQYLPSHTLTDPRPSLLHNNSNPSLSTSPGQYSHSPLKHSPQQIQPQSASSYPFLATGPHIPQHSSFSGHTAQPHSISYPPPSSQSPAHANLSASHSPHATSLPISPPAVPPRPSSAASTITDTMPGSFNPQSQRTPSPSPSRFSSLPQSTTDQSPSPSQGPALPPRQQYPASPSPSTSRFPISSETSRPPLPPTPSGALSTPTFSSKFQEATQGRSSGYVPPPPAYNSTQTPLPPPVDHAAAQRAQAEEAENQRRQRIVEEREAREASERERAIEEDRARKERERISEEKKLARIREAQEARAKKLAQEREDERLALEAEERERAAERERRERERIADEEFVKRLQAEEREREERERRDEEFARKMREDDERERMRREKEDEDYVKKLREEDSRQAEEERQRRLVEDERLARSLAERENEEEEQRRRSRPSPNLER